MTLSPRRQILLHWLPPGGVSLLLNLLLLHALSLTLLPRGLVALDSVLSVELESSPAPERAATHSRAASKTPPRAANPAIAAATTPATAEPENRDARSAERPTDIEPLYRVTQLPGFLRRVEPPYPESERALGRQARVLAEITLGESGEIVDLRIVQSGGPAFDAAVIAALRHSRFAPALVRDRSVSVRFQVPFQFKLD